MLNQPQNTAFTDADSDTVQPASPGRYRSLFAVFCALTAVVLARIYWIQAELQPSYLTALNVTSTEYELIPSRDGRILADTTVLAADRDLFSIQVHFRWLQEPADESWIRKLIRNRLTRAERQNPIHVEQIRESLLQQRQDLWTELAELTKHSNQDLTNRRMRIQQRVRRISDDVNRRHLERQQESNLADESGLDWPADPAQHNIFLRLAGIVRRSLTTPPGRSSEDRIVVREEEDYHTIVSDVPLDAAAQIRGKPGTFPGTRIQLTTRRTWPALTLASHVVGTRTALKPDEQQQLKSQNHRLPGSWLPRRGRSGVERSWDHRLRGTAGLRRIVRDRRMRVIESEIVRNPVAGQDVTLTLDPELQHHAEILLDQALNRSAPLPEENSGGSKQRAISGGCVLVMDVRHGRLLAAASAPAFDLSLFSSGTQDQWNAVNADTRRPFLSRITSAALPPGSVFKPVTAAAMLEEQIVQPDSPFFCQGFLQNPDEHRCLIFRSDGVGHSDLTLHRALAQSCNVYFFDAARRSGLQPVVEWARRFGFGAPTGTDLPFERSGSLPTVARDQQSARQRAILDREALGLAIGQSRLTATPLQIVRMMAAIANGGWLVVPHVATLEGVARRVDDPGVEPRDLARRRVPGLQVETIRAIREGLEATVEQPYGTGYRTVRLDDVPIAGKSGTAETSVENRSHAWFAGYVPADQPRFAVTVVLENGGSGSRVAGPVVREIVRFMAEEGIL